MGWTTRARMPRAAKRRRLDAKARSDNRDRMNEVIAACTKTETTTTWIDRFNAAGVPGGPIYGMDEVFADPQVRHLGLAQPLTSPELGDLKFVRQPVNLTRTPSSFVSAPPEAGEHTSEILGDLGYTAADITDLRTRGVV